MEFSPQAALSPNPSHEVGNSGLQAVLPPCRLKPELHACFGVAPGLIWKNRLVHLRRSDYTPGRTRVRCLIPTFVTNTYAKRVTTETIPAILSSAFPRHSFGQSALSKWGKAPISGWRDVIVPALSGSDLDVAFCYDNDPSYNDPFCSSFAYYGTTVGIEDDLNRSEFRTPEWRAPWVPVSKEHTPMLEAELSRELPAGHALYGRQARAIARRLDRDDVLFLLDGGPRVAVVHLTYSSRPEQAPEWPWARVFVNLEEWVQLCMLRDHAEYI